MYPHHALASTTMYPSINVSHYECIPFQNVVESYVFHNKMYPQIIYIKQYVPKRNVPQYKFYPLHAKCISHHKMYSLQIASISHVISQNKMYSIKKYFLHKMYHRSLNVSTPDLIYITQNVLHPKMYSLQNVSQH